MKRLLIALIIVTMYAATPVQAANGKMYFTDNADLNIKSDMGFICRNISFNPGYKMDDRQICDMCWIRLHNGELNQSNKITLLNDTDLHGLSLVTPGYSGIGRTALPSTQHTGMGLGLTDIELNEGALGYAVEDYLGYQFRMELGIDVSQNTILTAEYRYLGYDQPDVLDPHGFVFGARFLFD
jgi:hypothetical protein